MPLGPDAGAKQVALTSSVVKLPVLTNTKPIAADGELVLRWAAVPTREKVVRTRTWKQDVAIKPKSTEANPKKKQRMDA